MRRPLAVLAVTVALAGCSGGGNGRVNQEDRPTASPTVDTGSGDRELTAAQIKLTIKITDKDCFGEAGCNVGYRVRAGWPKAEVGADETYEVTYRVTGPDGGGQIGTLTINGDGTFDGGDEYASVPRSSTVLKATVTEVERVG